jgi:transposase
MPNKAEKMKAKKMDAQSRRTRRALVEDDNRMLREELTEVRATYLAKIDQLTAQVAALTQERVLRPGRGAFASSVEEKYKAALAQAVRDKRLFFSVLVRVLQNTKIENLAEG